MSREEARNERSDKAMQEWICQENIKNLRAQFASAQDETQRATLSMLIAEQEENLRQLQSMPQSSELRERE